MNTILLNTISDGKVIVRKTAENGGNAGGDTGGSGGGSSNIEYLDVSGMELSKNSKLYYLAIISIFAKAIIHGGSAQIIAPSLVSLSTMLTDITTISIKALAVDFSATYAEYLISAGQGSAGTIKDVLLRFGVTEEELAAIPRITKEEFNDYTNLHE